MSWIRVSTLAATGLVSLGCSSEPKPVGDTGCVDCPPGDSAPRPIERNLTFYAGSLRFLPLDESGNVASATVQTEAGQVEYPAYEFQFVDEVPSFTELCRIRYDIVESTLVDGGPFDFGASAKTWNVWQWTIELAEDDCDGIATAADREAMAGVLPPAVFYAALGEPEALSVTPPSPVAATWGIWSPDGSGATTPSEGGRFTDEGFASAIYDWDGEPLFDRTSATPREDLDTLEPGDQVLRSVIAEVNGALGGEL